VLHQQHCTVLVDTHTHARARARARTHTSHKPSTTPYLKFPKQIFTSAPNFQTCVSCVPLRSPLFWEVTENITVLIVHASTGMRMCMCTWLHFFYFNSILERNTMITVIELKNNKNLYNLLATSVLKYCFNV
jgi:hypothetical protein